jgi:hypothetical protein
VALRIEVIVGFKIARSTSIFPTLDLRSDDDVSSGASCWHSFLPFWQTPVSSCLLRVYLVIKDLLQYLQVSLGETMSIYYL